MRPKKKAKYNTGPTPVPVLGPILATITVFPPPPQVEGKPSPTSVLSEHIPLVHPPPLDISSQTLVLGGVKPFKIQNHIAAILPCILKKPFTDPKLLKTEIISHLQKVFSEDYPNQLDFYRKLHKDQLSNWFEQTLSKICQRRDSEFFKCF